MTRYDAKERSEKSLCPRRGLTNRLPPKIGIRNIIILRMMVTIRRINCFRDRAALCVLISDEGNDSAVIGGFDEGLDGVTAQSCYQSFDLLTVLIAFLNCNDIYIGLGCL